jgi:hypothetical protein
MTLIFRYQSQVAIYELSALVKNLLRGDIVIGHVGRGRRHQKSGYVELIGVQSG